MRSPSLSRHLDIDEEKIREEGSTDGYYMPTASEIQTSDGNHRHVQGWRIRRVTKVTKSELRPDPYTSGQKNANTFPGCCLYTTIARILEGNKLGTKIQCGGRNPGLLSKQNAGLLQRAISYSITMMRY